MVGWVGEDAAAAEVQGENIVNVLAGCGGGCLETLHSVVTRWS